MYMVGVATYFYHLTFELVTDTSEIRVEFCFYRWVYQRFAVLGAEYEVYVIFYK